MAPAGNREYELVLFGATGFTGKLCAQHITKHLPTDLKWAIAGRNSKKLAAVVEELKQLNNDRQPPSIEISDLKPDDLDKVARKAKLMITTVGPYHMYGTPVIEACVKNGTHYIDCTGETPWIYEVQRQFGAQAKQNGAIIMPQCGIESAPADVVAYALVNFVRKQANSGVKEMVHSVQKINGGVSGGTVLSAMTIMDSYGLKQLSKSMHPFSLCDVKPTGKPAKPFSQLLLGSFNVPGLGLMTDSLWGIQDLQIVYRTWGLLDRGAYYGPKFRYSSWMRAANRVTGLLFHYAMSFFMVMLVVPPFRWLVRKLAPEPGTGPSIEKQAKHFINMKAVATTDASPPRRAVLDMKIKGDMYQLTGMFMAEAAMVILRPKSENWVQKLGGGFVTPACLGEEYVERLGKVGVSTEIAFEK